MYAGGSAREKAASLRVEAAALREQAELRDQEARQWRDGADGEARVGRALAPLESQGWTVLHDRLVRPDTSRANLDHLAIGPGGVVLIDSKNWSAGAWVYDGMLFRNGPTGPVACRDELAHIRRDAAAVGERAGHKVLPVLCLSGPRSGKVTSPVEVAGVHVVAVGRLAAFLRGLPETLASADLAPLVERVASAFPTACAVPPPVSTPTSVPSPALRQPARRTSRNGNVRGRQPRPSRALLAVAAAVAFVVVGPRLITALTGAVARMGPSTTPAAAPFPAPCAGVSDAQVAQAVGRPVYRFATSGTDTCRWGYTRPPATYYPADVEIQTGWMVKFAADAAHGRLQLTHASTSEQLLVPQFVAIPGASLPASATTQPLAVSVTISRAVPRARAASSARALALLTQAHMPTGPGATTVSAVR